MTVYPNGLFVPAVSQKYNFYFNSLNYSQLQMRFLFADSALDHNVSAYSKPRPTTTDQASEQDLNEEFPSKLLFAVDSRDQICLKQCRVATNCINVDGSIIKFSQLVFQVLFGSFYIILPPTFTMKTHKAAAATSRRKDSSHK